MYRLTLLWLVITTAAYLIGRYHRINKRPRPHAGDL